MADCNRSRGKNWRTVLTARCGMVTPSRATFPWAGEIWLLTGAAKRTLFRTPVQRIVAFPPANPVDGEILTMDLQDFSVYRIRGRERFDTLDWRSE